MVPDRNLKTIPKTVRDENTQCIIRIKVKVEKPRFIFVNITNVFKPQKQLQNGTNKSVCEKLWPSSAA